MINKETVEETTLPNNDSVIDPTDVSTVDTSSEGKYEQAYQSQKIRAEKEKAAKEKLQAELDELRGAGNVATDSTSTVETKSEPTTINKTDMSLRDISEISKLASMHSIEDLEFGKQFIGTSFGSNLSEVMDSAGIKAQLALQKEKSNSNDVMDVPDISIATIETKNSIIRDIKEGRIDINKPENAKYRKAWVEHMAFGDK